MQNKDLSITYINDLKVKKPRLIQSNLHEESYIVWSIGKSPPGFDAYHPD